MNIRRGMERVRMGRCPTRRAMTLLEVLLALIVVSLLSTGVAAMLYAAGYGTDAQRDARRLAVRVQQARLRLNDAIRDARQILDIGESNPGYAYLVLWRGDTNAEDENSNAVNLSELQMIELDENSDRLVSYEPGPDLVDARCEENHATAIRAKVASGDFVPRTWANGVANFEVSLDQATVADARLVVWRMTMPAGGLSETVCGHAALRCPGPAAVGEE